MEGIETRVEEKLEASLCLYRLCGLGRGTTSLSLGRPFTNGDSILNVRVVVNSAYRLPGTEQMLNKRAISKLAVE